MSLCTTSPTMFRCNFAKLQCIVSMLKITSSLENGLICITLFEPCSKHHWNQGLSHSTSTTQVEQFADAMQSENFSVQVAPDWTHVQLVQLLAEMQNTIKKQFALFPHFCRHTSAFSDLSMPLNALVCIRVDSQWSTLQRSDGHKMQTECSKQWPSCWLPFMQPLNVGFAVSSCCPNDGTFLPQNMMWLILLQFFINLTLLPISSLVCQWHLVGQMRWE